VVSSGINVTEVEPQFDVMDKLSGRGVSVSGIAPPESEFDFYGRFFCPKAGVNEVNVRILLFSRYFLLASS